MPRVLFWCASIVAAFQIQLAAAPLVSTDLTVPPTVVALARALGLDPARDRARFMSEMARLLYSRPASKTDAVARMTRSAAAAPSGTGEAALHVPVPLTPPVWNRLLKRTVPPDHLIAAIVEDRQASLVCYALAALDDETLTFLADHPTLLARLHERDSAPFAAFGASLRIHDGRIVPPGGADAVPLWEAVVHQRVDAPEAFLAALYGENEARLGYLFNTVAEVDAPHANFALGLWLENKDTRLARLIQLGGICIHQYGEWHVADTPFFKPLNDFSTALMRVRVEATGRPSAPASRAFWDQALDVGDGGDANLIDAAWLAGVTAPGDMFARADRLDQFAFGQRAFAGLRDAEWPEAVDVVRAFPKFRMLMLTLERMGIRSPVVQAAALRRARSISLDDANRAFWTLAQFQGSLALMASMVHATTLDTAAAEKLVQSLSAVPIGDDGRYAGGVARWIEEQLIPALPAASGAEETLISAVAGPESAARAPRLTWEGQRYHLDLAAAERSRLIAVREKQGGYSVDAALQLAQLALALRQQNQSVDALHALAGRLGMVADALAVQAGTRAPMVAAPGVQAPRPPPETVRRVADDLRALNATRDARALGRLESSLGETVDVVTSEALLAIAYAATLGEPDGTALLGSNVALRHDFGLGVRDTDVRNRRSWTLPRQDFQPGVPWHVTGALVGLDVALAQLALHRIDPDSVEQAPKVSSIERDAFAVGVALMDARALRDEDRDAIAAAIARGEHRIAGLAAGEEPLDAVADAVVLDGWRRRELEWLLEHDAAHVRSLFSLVEVMQLGGSPDAGRLLAWGMPAFYQGGCLCLALQSPASWRLWSGHSQVAIMPSFVSDLNLRVAVILADLKLPTALARTVLAGAVQDLIDAAPVTDPEDWRGVARAAQALTRQHVEDYVAWAASIDGPLQLDDETSAVGP